MTTETNNDEPLAYWDGYGEDPETVPLSEVLKAVPQGCDPNDVCLKFSATYNAYSGGVNMELTLEYIKPDDEEEL